MTDGQHHHHHLGRDGEQIVLFDDHVEGPHRLRVQWLNSEGFAVRTIETERVAHECSTRACPLRRHDDA